jgi:hypothetical protein
MFQTFLLGSPKYVLEPETDKKILPDEENEYKGFGITLLVLFLAWLLFY